MNLVESFRLLSDEHPGLARAWYQNGEERHHSSGGVVVKKQSPGSYRQFATPADSRTERPFSTNRLRMLQAIMSFLILRVTCRYKQRREEEDTRD